MGTEPAGEFLSLFSEESIDPPRAAWESLPQVSGWRLEEMLTGMENSFLVWNFFFPQFEVDSSTFYTKKLSWSR